MATTVEKYIAKCQEVVDAQPKYQNGASSLTECDCIGMDKFAFRELGVSFSTTGTNYSARKQVDNLRAIISNSDLKIGDVVFKAHEPGESGYALPEKYQEGGKEYNGDLRDYYHIGTVKSVYPLEIIHMTTPTAKTDKKLGKWALTGSWKQEYIRTDEPTPEPVPEPEKAIVWADNGKPVNLRARPSKAAALVERVPCGDSVTVIDYSPDWCRLKWRDKIGYMMTEFLLLPETVLYTVEINHLTFEQAESIKAQYPGVSIHEERG